MQAKKKNLVAFQGEFGANSDIAARTVFPAAVTIPCVTFEEVYAAVLGGKAGFGIIPVDNSIAGRVADVHRLLPTRGVHIVGEHFQPIIHALLAVPGAALADITEVHSHPHALAQCRTFLKKYHIRAVPVEDTAGAARAVAARGDRSVAALASPLAATLYGLKALRQDVSDHTSNTTRFIILSKKATQPSTRNKQTITSLFFRVRNTPGALFKALGGFATTGINLLKLESYMADDFRATEFYAEAQAHPDDPLMKHALEDLRYFSDILLVLGAYPVHPYRQKHTSEKKK